MKIGIPVVLAALTLSAASASLAQSKPDVARADSLFAAAKALLDAGQTEDACTKFAESKRVAPGLGVTLYLGDCLERLGRTASAWTEFRSAEGIAHERNDARAEIARTRAEQLEPKLYRLTIAVSPTLARTGLTILCDGAAVAEEVWGVAVPIDPGEHVVVARPEGQQRRTFKVHVDAENPRASVQVEDASPAFGHGSDHEADPVESANPTAASGDRDSNAPSGPASWSTLQWVGLGVGAAGLVGLGVGTGFGVAAKSKLDQSNDGPCDAQDRCDPRGLALRQDATHAANTATIGMVAGGALLGAGIVLFFVTPHGTSHAEVAVTPAGSPQGAALWVHGRF